jgi:hypothetical protein
MKRLLLLTTVLFSSASSAFSGEIQFVEDFSLATDRDAALKQLIPGTKDYYYWHCLHYLNTEQYDKVDEMLVPWVKRHNETARVWEIRTRKALLTYDRDNQASLQYLRSRFGITHPHRKEQLNAEPDLPTALDQAQISQERFKRQALARHGNSLNGFEDSALDWLILDDLNPTQRRQLLSRLARPDHANLVQLVVDDLNYPKTGGFGSIGIHQQLLKAQLDELLQRKPALLNHQNFVRAYLRKLQPSLDVDWRHNPEEMQQFLERLQSFAERLAPVHNTLKAHILYHRLVFDRSQGTYDKERFLEYLKLPRRTGYISKAMRDSEALKRYACDLNSNYDGTTLLPPIINDEPLVRSCLAHFFVDAGNTSEFEPYVNDVYLKHLFAETKIVNGLGEPEEWASMLPPEPFRQLKERVDIDFDYASETQFAAGEQVSLDVHIKNVSTLIVKVFEINTSNFYRQNGREVDTDINLDGLVANTEQTHSYDESPFRRIKRTFDFPMLNKEGVYVIDLIGNGQSSRALIRKGRLRQLVRTTPAGHAFTILDENNEQVKDATLWLSGHSYSAGEDGIIHVPFSTNPGRQSVVITAPCSQVDGATYSALSYFNHEPEKYEFTAGFYVDRESLLERKTAKVLIRPGLSVNGTPVSLKLLEDVKLTITSTDLDGVSTSVDLPDFKLFEDREAVHEFQVPQRLASLHFQLSAKIKQVITGTQINVATQDTFSLNGIGRTEKIEDLHLLQADGSYVLELRGLTGESRASRPVVFNFKHRDFRDTIQAVLKTDTDGRISLGELEGIHSLTASGPQGTSHTWTLLADRHTYPQLVHGRVGETLVLPYLGSAGAPRRNELSLLEYSGGTFSVDRFENLAIENALIVIEGLPAGDFNLYLKDSATQITIRVSAGEELGPYIVGPYRQLETKPLKSLQIEQITTDDDKVTVKLQNASEFTRVHVLATRYVPEYDAFGHLSRVRGAEPYLFRQALTPSVYLTGRNIGDEYRYIIDRKYATKYPGNMLERPSLLLNPWAVRETETGQQIAQRGGEFAPKSEMGGFATERPGADARSAGLRAEHFANLDFLASPATVALNLVPDENGVVEIPGEALGAHQYVRIVAVDPLNVTSRKLTLPEPDPMFLDLRLAKGLDPEAHFTQQKQISIVPGGQAFTLKDISASKFESYDNLSRVYALYATLNNDPKLVEFSFILNWPEFEPEKKRELYSKYASHELSFFLSRKDPEFFQNVIKPYLANKKDKTFMDHYLLDNDLSDYVGPWKYGQLNIVERILLARRIEAEREHTARHVGDLYALLPPDIERFIRLFDTAIQSSALETEDKLGLKAAVEELSVRADNLMEPGGAASRARAPAARPPGAPDPAAFARKKALAKQMMKEKEAAESLRERSEVNRRRAFAAAGAAADAKPVDADLDFYAADGELRNQLRQLYRKLEKTKEWAENNYHHLTIDRQGPDLVTVNALWTDYAEHDTGTPFLSRNLAEASRSFPEMLLALAVLDLPFESPEHETEFDGTQMTLTPGGSVVVFHEEVEPAVAPAGATNVLVSQNFFKYGDRTRVENGETVDKFVTDEFIIHTVYGCQIVITNPTSTRQKLNVLLQIPRGSLPVLGGRETKTVHIDLEPYHTHRLEYHFYFPMAGEFPHFPVHVARNEKLIAFAEPMPLNVVESPTTIDTNSWDYISQHGSLDDVVNFLNSHNINRLNLDRIAWRMHDEDAFEKIIPLLAQRHVYSHTLWSYSLLHNSIAAANEFLRHADNIVNECGGPLSSTLVTLDPVERRTYEFLEYRPLVNARTHALGKRRQIVNERFLWQYHRFLKNLSYSRTLDDTQLLAVTYYLLLQDRIEESLATFQRVNRDNVVTRMQYDYCDAYLKLFGAELEQARAIAAKYADHPVDRWRNTFAVISAQLDEATGQAAAEIDLENRDQQQGQLAATEPNFDFNVEARKIRINYQNLDSVRVNFYEVDVELLFSRNPFVQEFGKGFTLIKPNDSLDLDLKKDDPSVTIDLPEAFENSNVLVEVVGAGQTKAQPYFANSLSVQVIENYGQVRVTHKETRKPLPKTYVKVYAQTAGGEVKFYKDGYTDLRGRFDYASLNTNELDVAQKFSILILSDEHGAIVREATPPKQ